MKDRDDIRIAILIVLAIIVLLLVGSNRMAGSSPPLNDSRLVTPAAAPPLESGNVYLPGREAPDLPAGYQADDWVASLIEEAASFPNGKHDDQVDSFVIGAEEHIAAGNRMGLSR